MMNDVLNKLKAPAIGLIITGALNGILGILSILSGILRLTGVVPEQLPTDDAERMGYYVGTGLSYGVGVLSLLVAPLIILGAIKMMNGQKPGLAKTAAILAIIPLTSCCFLLGAIFGIWALVVLSKPDVKAAFNSGSFGRNNFPPQPPQNFR